MKWKTKKPMLTDEQQTMCKAFDHALSIFDAAVDQCLDELKEYGLKREFYYNLILKACASNTAINFATLYDVSRSEGNNEGLDKPLQKLLFDIEKNVRTIIHERLRNGEV